MTLRKTTSVKSPFSGRHSRRFLSAATLPWRDIDASHQMHVFSALRSRSARDSAVASATIAAKTSSPSFSTTHAPAAASAFGST